MGLAGREILENLFTGLIILSSSPFEVGDEVLFTPPSGPVRHRPALLWVFFNCPFSADAVKHSHPGAFAMPSVWLFLRHLSARLRACTMLVHPDHVPVCLSP